MTSPLTEQQLTNDREQEIRTLDLEPLMSDRSAVVISGHLAALLGEVDRLREAMEQIRHLHKDSPMGPCPVCVDGDAMARGDDGTLPYPCPTARLAGAQDCDPPHVRAARPAVPSV
jgi:hypothetical protein